MWKNKKISVVFATYREKESIRRAIEDFLATGFVDEIVVVNNNAEPGTDEEIKKAEDPRIRLIYEKKQGMGFAFQKGLEEATGDCVVLSEPDGTFEASDIERFLVYAKDFPAVFGTRTNQSAILEGAAMGLFRKLANVFEAKIIEVFFATNALTDIGCIYRLLHKDVIQKIKPFWREGGALFPTEILLLAVSQRVNFIEIPITFKERVGESTMTNNRLKLAKWGLYILWFIIVFWIRWIPGSLRVAKK
ncbi:MAG: hypothetical protein A2931_00895 [Candidatus Niyogibacteria bacterium RIFCSPLOWO2_01_FULL_45_48]|uniref:Glycosyltransferase 2-like domain-containing protein n=2 Tax=Candidatus Niyogiibacteriota TaxID=1817912 RepID=A0A1G2F0I5_9BACT|nr:MAG: hypothetical protein A2931_00895 [Candidatus Niyogibacteria bacterium RIFCSPLOWO2_01_FULL_45_48]OGZ30857.1 MAG: hypothetical protein A2835_01060 [Candidatus Niyogibacteria bacterium RIFCSPHIGHO2_01_FULL_45_28]OGZ31447.1 MAG: hypothetical protein A3J00_02380 [Candidatus Niyogibacteria bacterium RIFCSPLOWO2_02_FULL_45_13]